MLGRLHEAFVNDRCIRALVDVFGKPGEVGSGRFRSRGQTGLAGKLVRDRSLLCHPLGVLAGDTTANGLVNSSDVAQTQSQSGQPVGLGNFREDVTINGQINSSDIGFVQAHSGTGLP